MAQTKTEADLGPRIIVALDVADIKSCEALLDKLDPSLCKVKIGNELFTRAGPQQVETVVKRGFDVFLDLKYHDIPNTVANACRAAVDLGVWMINVHAGGGVDMMQAARDAVNPGGNVRLIAVTVLTSLTNQDLDGLGFKNDSDQQAMLLASLSKQCGFDGVVCSAQEATLLRKHCGDDFLLVTPGVRPLAAEKGDQQRVMTPEAAIAAGSSYLVIGRPVPQANDPSEALHLINASLRDAEGSVTT